MNDQPDRPHERAGHAETGTLSERARRNGVPWELVRATPITFHVDGRGVGHVRKDCVLTAGATQGRHGHLATMDKGLRCGACSTAVTLFRMTPVGRAAMEYADRLNRLAERLETVSDPARARTLLADLERAGRMLDAVDESIAERVESAAGRARTQLDVLNPELLHLWAARFTYLATHPDPPRPTSGERRETSGKQRSQCTGLNAAEPSTGDELTGLYVRWATTDPTDPASRADSVEEQTWRDRWDELAVSDANADSALFVLGMRKPLPALSRQNRQTDNEAQPDETELLSALWWSPSAAPADAVRRWVGDGPAILITTTTAAKMLHEAARSIHQDSAWARWTGRQHVDLTATFLRRGRTPAEALELADACLQLRDTTSDT